MTTAHASAPGAAAVPTPDSVSGSVSLAVPDPASTSTSASASASAASTSATDGTAGDESPSNETLDENYARAGYHARQRWGTRPAVVLIDFAHAYYDEDGPLFGGEGCRVALDNAIRLAPAARAAGVPLVITAVAYRPGEAGADGGAFYGKVPALACFEVGRDSQRLADGLAVEDGDILVEKHYPSAFFGTSLASTLRWLKVDTLLLAGVTTSGCVRASCVDSISHGFVTLVVSDAVGDRASEPHEANLYDMSAKYADLCTTDEAIAYLRSCRSASDDHREGRR